MKNSDLNNNMAAADHSLHEVCRANLLPVGDALYAIGGKWKLRIIIALSSGHTRFNDLQRSLEGISAKTLSNDLRDLEQNGFVIRNVDNAVPVVVSYVLTEYSYTLQNVIHALAEWGTMHRQKIKQG
ncbi:helix-turn-helix domain-containing protein [Flavobacterium sp. DGU38]|uniref:Helix-turn-helix domain-containing protein n=1 Tax=Flavobacterium calami TaxID=3139144 RepID=A0ABU9IQ05_9FLAO